jgi:hypothetical protein
MRRRTRICARGRRLRRRAKCDVGGGQEKRPQPGEAGAALRAFIRDLLGADLAENGTSRQFASRRGVPGGGSVKSCE